MGKLWEPRKLSAERKASRRFWIKLLRQFAAACLIFIFIWLVFAIDSPYVRPVQAKIRGWFSEDYSIEPVIKFFNDVGLWGDTFDRAAYEAMKIEDDLPEISLTVPVSGQIAKKDNNREGIVIAAAEGTAVKSAMAGVVSRIANEEELGRIVEISGSDGLVAVYGHCSEILVNLNDVVLQGQVIARVGKTGQANYPQLYFKIAEKGRAIDPVQLFLPSDVKT